MSLVSVATPQMLLREEFVFFQAWVKQSLHVLHDGNVKI